MGKLLQGFGLTERSGPDLFCLAVVGSVPHLLELVVVPGLEVAVLEDGVELLVVPSMEGHGGFCSEDAVRLHLAVFAEEMRWKYKCFILNILKLRS